MRKITCIIMACMLISLAGYSQPEIRVKNQDLSKGAPLTLVDSLEANIKYLNPADIESVTVLKNESATSLFGDRGKHGVILVTMKKESNYKRLNQLYDSFGISQNERALPVYIDDVLVQQPLLVLLQEKHVKAIEIKTKPLSPPGTDQQKVIQVITANADKPGRSTTN